MTSDTNPTHNKTGKESKSAGGRWTALLLVALLLCTCVPNAQILMERLEQLAKDARDHSFLARVGDEIVTTQQLDNVVRVDPTLRLNAALGDIIDQSILVQIGRDSGIDVSTSLNEYARQRANEIEKARTLLNLTPDEINKSLERSLLAEQAMLALASSMHVSDEELQTYYSAHKEQYKSSFNTVAATVEQDVIGAKIRDYLDYLHSMSVRELRSGYVDGHIPTDMQPMDPGRQLRLSILTLLTCCFVVIVIEWVLARKRAPLH